MEWLEEVYSKKWTCGERGRRRKGKKIGRKRKKDGVARRDAGKRKDRRRERREWNVARQREKGLVGNIHTVSVGNA